MAPVSKINPWFILLLITAFYFYERTRDHGEKQRDVIPDTTIPAQATNRRSAVVFTPYDLSPGGGEKYLFDFIHNIQENGAHVTLITYEQNYCGDLDCVRSVAMRLRVPLDVSSLKLQLVPDIDSARVIQSYTPDIFFEIGNYKFPKNFNPAKLGVYMCQFPFDLDASPSNQETNFFSTYDTVFLNSRFSETWYISFVASALLKMSDLRLQWPSFKVVHPSVEPIDAPEIVASDFPDAANTCNILLLGRIFQGRQSKGHIPALEAFEQVASLVTDREVVLHIVGQQQPSHYGFVTNLELIAQSIEAKVLFHVNASSAELAQIVYRCEFQWHVTGIDVSLDPASFEHFGISIVESMHAGIIPIVVRRGGGAEVVGDAGAVVGDVRELVATTVRMIRLGKEEKERYKRKALKRAKDFSKSAFDATVSLLLSQSTASHYVSLLSRLHYTCAPMERASTTPIHSVFIFVDNPIFYLRMLFHNIAGVLGEEWRINILFTLRMAVFLRYIFLYEFDKMGDRIAFRETLLTKAEYVLKQNLEFWKQIPTENVLFLHEDDVFVPNYGLEFDQGSEKLILNGENRVDKRLKWIDCLERNNSTRDACGPAEKGIFKHNYTVLNKEALRAVHMHPEEQKLKHCAVKVPYCNNMNFPDSGNWFLDRDHGGDNRLTQSLAECQARNWESFCDATSAEYKLVAGPLFGSCTYL